MAARAIDSFGARTVWAAPRDTDADMKRKAREHGHFPRVKRRPLGDELIARMKDFEKNAQLGALLTRRRMMDEGRQYEIQQQETLAQNAERRMPALRAGMATTVGAEKVRDEVAGVSKEKAARVQQKQEPEEVPFEPRSKSRARAPMTDLEKRMREAERVKDVFEDPAESMKKTTGRVKPGTGITK